MRRLIAVLFLALPVVALAQAPERSDPGLQAWQIMYSREVEAHQRDLAAAVDLTTKLKAVTDEKNALQAKLDAAAKPAETGKP